jgi:hypothetical protein
MVCAPWFPLLVLISSPTQFAPRVDTSLRELPASARVDATLRVLRACPTRCFMCSLKSLGPQVERPTF